MFKTLIAGVTAASLTLTSVGPASAQDFNEDDFGKLLLGLAAAAALGTYINNQRDVDTVDAHRGGRIGGIEPRALPDHRAPVVTERPRYDGYINPPRHDRSLDDNPRRDSPKGQEPRHRDRRADLPRHCLRGFETAVGYTELYLRRCLERHDTDLRALPRQCQVQVYTEVGTRRGFDPTCLLDRGYRLTRGRR